jgi:hypothetical protein
MATAWQTLEEAALTLGISSRTLHRRLAKGEFQTRLANGRREVLVTVDVIVPNEPTADTSATSSDQPDVIGQGGTELSADVQNSMLMLHEDRLRRTDLAIMAYQQSVNVSAATARRATINSRLAWGTAGGLAAILFVAVIWATHRVTHVSAQVDHLSGQVRQLSDTAVNRERVAEKLRSDAETARLAAARAEGELSAAKSQIDQLSQQTKMLAELSVAREGGDEADSAAAPTTQPFSFVDLLMPIAQ